MSILARAGFEIDYIHKKALKEHSMTARLLPLVNGCLVFTAAEAVSNFKYDLVVPADDECIGDILDSNLTIELKKRLLPVVNEESFQHLYSKCGLSQVLSASSVETPPFSICNTTDDIEHAALKIGFPLLIKIDRSGGGSGVFECSSLTELHSKAKNLRFPLLLQKKIEGTTIDLTAFYQNGQLVHFTYSKFIKSIRGQFGPSSFREYTQIGVLPSNVFQQLQELGTALGANGFVNATSIECSETNRRYIFEADMRPNVWVDYGRFLGNDAALSFYSYFNDGKKLTLPLPIFSNYPLACKLPYLRRLSLCDLMINRYSCWKRIDSFDVLYELFINRLTTNSLTSFCCSIPYRVDLAIRIFLSKHLKPLLPASLWKKCSTFYRKVIQRFG